MSVSAIQCLRLFMADTRGYAKTPLHHSERRTTPTAPIHDLYCTAYLQQLSLALRIANPSISVGKRIDLSLSLYIHAYVDMIPVKLVRHAFSS